MTNRVKRAVAKGLLWMGIAIPLLGCAAIFKGTSESITVGSNPAGAQVFLDGQFVGVTPTQIRIPSGPQSHQITFRMPGAQDQTAVITQNLQAGYLVLDILFTGLIGIVVDAATGAWYAASTNTVMATMTPAQPQYGPPPGYQGGGPVVVPAPNPMPGY
jgi:hypothetical protein